MTNAAPLAGGSDDDQAHGGVSLTPAPAKGGGDDLSIALCHQTFRERKHVLPVGQAMGPAKLRGQRLGMRQVGFGHGAKQHAIVSGACVAKGRERVLQQHLRQPVSSLICLLSWTTSRHFASANQGLRAIRKLAP
ncbi:hypothetical protein FQZ97_1097320 [compost metagenome]